MSRPRYFKDHLLAEVADLAQLCRGSAVPPLPPELAKPHFPLWRLTAAELSALRSAFYAMPDADQRRALNGWRPAPVRVPRENLFAVAGECGTVRVMRLCAGANFGDRWWHTFKLAHASADAVQVDVREGATREEVMAELVGVYEMVRDRWPDMIDDDRGLRVAADRAAERAAKEEGGSPALTDSPHAGKQAGEPIGAATAAA